MARLPSPDLTGLASRTPVDEAARRDARMLVMMRCVLAFVALAIVVLGFSRTGHASGLILFTLGAYAVYAAVLALHAVRTGWPLPPRALHWIDVAVSCCLVALSGGATSIYLGFFLFAILGASFMHGFREGILVTLAALAGFGMVALPAVFAYAGSELDGVLSWGATLFALGYMISYWGGYERLLKRRLALLADIHAGSEARYGERRAIHANMSRLLAFERADSCILLLDPQEGESEGLMYRCSRDGESPARQPQPLARSAAAPLFDLPRNVGCYYHAPGLAPLARAGCVVWDLRTGTRLRPSEGGGEAIASLLDAPAFVTVPYRQHNGRHGRLFLAARRSFSRSNVDFLSQAATAIASVVDNIAMMEELVARASEQERRKISRDLHDAAVQPYIGLKLALDALLRDAGQDALGGRLAEIAEMSGATIRDLRAYAGVSGATGSSGAARMSEDFLLAAIRAKGEQLARYYGLQVTIEPRISHPLEGDLAMEVFHFVSEGLSNILRHTTARRAFVRLVCEGTRLRVEIGNIAPVAPPPFTPASLVARAEAIGGSVVIDRADGETVVRIYLPLSAC